VRKAEREKRRLVSVAVEVLKKAPDPTDIFELAELVKDLAHTRQVKWQYSGQITEALKRALRYEVKE
jgi:hypothetical protein